MIDHRCGDRPSFARNMVRGRFHQRKERSLQRHAPLQCQADKFSLSSSPPTVSTAPATFASGTSGK